MRFLAEFVMQSRTKAMAVAAVTALIPFLHLISAAVVALVWLRMEKRDAWPVAAAAFLPGLIYFFSGDPSVLTVVAMAIIFAELLKQQQNWVYPLYAGLGCGVVMALSFSWIPQELEQELFDLLLASNPHFESLGFEADQHSQLLQVFSQLLNGMITTLQVLTALLSLMLGRWWQAQLYHPQGFALEFQSLRLPAWYGLLLVVFLLVLWSGWQGLLPLLPLIPLPLIIAAFALIHGVVRIQGYNSFWLGLLYLLMLFAQPYIILLLVGIAMADSLLDFRSRLAPPPPPSDGSGEA
ncbi:hypothetical protein V6U78_05975 [Marinospirillum sp. MEB164]|uniref:DUF2232 domain-containing protein n=1 Tax=Marinospirillum alkalitolerans TaxID=3123374 RepID=A0ABW8PWA7_9GAMM